MGFAENVLAARQFISHKHVKTNGQLQNAGLVSANPGDVMQVGCSGAMHSQALVLGIGLALACL